MDDPILQNLTAAQREAVLHIDGPLLILAGPGSGKTRVVTHRIAWMLKQGIPAANILALTFTNKAADEMRRRLQALAPGEPVWMGTFHRFCAMLLRKYAPLAGLSANYSIFDADDSRKLLGQAIDEAGPVGEGYSVDRIARAISRAKNNLIGPDEFQRSVSDPSSAAVQAVYPLYQERLRQSNAADFDDLLMHVARLLKESDEIRLHLDERYRYILVDEYQDTNFVQYLIVRALSQTWPNLGVTGDPDQSIYRWRGAELRNILSFEHDYPQVKLVRLEQNYRSTKRILRVADALISHNRRRKPKRLFTDNEEGERIILRHCSSQDDEAEQIAARIQSLIEAGAANLSDFAIFYRVNALSRAIEAALRRRNLHYQVVQGAAFYERKEIKDMLAWLHLLNNPSHELALRRVINTPARGLGKSTLERLAAYAGQQRLTLLEAARQAPLLDSLGARAAKSLRGFTSMVDRLCGACHLPVESLLNLVLDETGYRRMLLDSPAEEDQERLANVEELITDAREFSARHGALASLESYLERTSLVSDVDAWKSETNLVSLMTLHAAKGLEFPHVFIVAVENGVLPHQRIYEQNQDAKDDEIEEERRLLFVGMTRAKRRLELSRANRRMFRGVDRSAAPSSFLLELPLEEIEQLGKDDRPPYRWAADDYADEYCHEPSAAEPVIVVRPDVAAQPSDLQSSSTSASLPPEAPPPLKTASAMIAASAAGNAVPPGAFRKDKLVVHPEYGEGRIVAIAGVGPRRQATVRFHGDQQEHTFMLAHAPLRPLES